MPRQRRSFSADLKVRAVLDVLPDDSVEATLREGLVKTFREEKLDEEDIRLALHWQLRDGLITRQRYEDCLGFVEQPASLGAAVISNSYGGHEAGAVPASLRNTYNHPGKVIQIGRAHV